MTFTEDERAATAKFPRNAIATDPFPPAPPWRSRARSMKLEPTESAARDAAAALVTLAYQPKT